MPILNRRTPAYTPQPKYVSNYNGFSGGLNLFYTPTEIKSSELAQADNCMLTGQGVVTGRWGSREYFDAGGEKILMLENYNNLNTGANELLAVTNAGYLIKQSGASYSIIGGASYASGSTINSAQIANYQYIVSTSTDLTRYDGTNITTYTAINAPISAAVSLVSGASGTAIWSYKVTALSVTGETLPSTSATLSGASFDRELFTASITWAQPSTASTSVIGFNIYAGLPGDETLIDSVGPNIREYTDNGMSLSSIFPPTANTTSGVKAKYIKKFDDRLVIAGVDGDPTMVMISGKYPYQDRFNWQNGGGFIRVNPDGGDEITGIEIVGQDATGGVQTPSIIVTMKESTHLIQLSFITLGNYSVLNPSVSQISPQGCSSFKSIVSIQNLTFYMGRLGLQTVGYEQNFLAQIRTREVSARIRPYIQAILPGDLENISAAYLDYKYIFSMPSTKDTMIYDFERGAFMGPWKTPFGITQWLQYIDDAGKVHYLAGCDDGKVREFSSDYKSDSGLPIVKVMKTRKDDFGNWSVLKTLELIYMLFRNVSGTVSVNILYEKRDGTTSSIAKSFELQGDSGGTGWGTDIWGTHNWGESNTNVVTPTPDDTIKWASLYKTARTIQVEVSQVNTEVNFELADMRISATLQPEGSLSAQLRI